MALTGRLPQGAAEVVTSATGDEPGANCIRDEGRPLGAGHQGQAPNHLKLRRLRADVVNVEAKVTTRSWQVRSEKTNKREPLMTCRKLFNQCRNRDGRLTREKAQRIPEFRLGGTRHKGGVSSDQAQIRNVRTCRSDAKERTQVDSLRERASTNAEHRGGAIRSSDETHESGWSEGVASSRRRDRSTAINRVREEPMTPSKPFAISKRMVWEAYKAVKANKGAPGVDGQTIESFGRNLARNLYCIWNRLASGSYFPPPVLQVRSRSVTAACAHSVFPPWEIVWRRPWSRCT